MSLMPVFSPVTATAYRLDNATADGVTFSIRTGSSINAADSITWTPDGTRFFVVEQSIGDPAILAYYNCSFAGSISTASFGGDISLGSTQRDWDSIDLRPDGSQVFITAGATIYTFSLSSAFGGTATAVRDTFLGTGLSSAFFNADGTVLFYLRNTTLYRRTLSTAYNTSTAGSESIEKTGIGGRVSVTRGGTRLLVMNGGDVDEYSGPAYDFGSHTLRETFTTGSQEHATYSPNGRKMQTFSFFTVTQYSTVG